jgi:putative ABC transport system permease protein
MKDAWRLALRNLARNRRRNLATGVAIAFGFAGMMLLGGYAIRIESFLRTNAVYLQHVGHLAIYKEGGLEKAATKPSKYGLDAAEQARVAEVLAAEPAVELTARYLRGVGLAGNGCKSVPFTALGVEPPVEARLLAHPEVQRASPELARPLRGGQLADYPAVDGAVALSTGLARLLGKSRIHDETGGAVPAPGLPDCAAPDAAARLAADANVQLAGLTYGGSLSAVDGEVVNVFRTPLAETEDGTVVATLDVLQRLYETDQVTYMAAYLKDHARAKALAPVLERRLRDAGLAVSVYPFDDERLSPYYVGSMGMIASIVLFIGVLVVAVVSLSMLNAMTLTVLERTREIGMFRALGFTRRQMLGLFLREAAALTVLALGAGALLGGAVAAAVNAANIRFEPPGISGDMQLLVTPTAGLCLGLVAILLPLSLLVTLRAVRRRTREPVVTLLTEAAA